MVLLGIAGGGGAGLSTDHRGWAVMSTGPGWESDLWGKGTLKQRLGSQEAWVPLEPAADLSQG